MNNTETPYDMNNSDILEFLDNNNWEKSQYMELILKVLHDNGTSKEDTNLIQNAIYSYNTAK